MNMWCRMHARSVGFGEHKEVIPTHSISHPYDRTAWRSHSPVASWRQVQEGCWRSEGERAGESLLVGVELQTNWRGIEEWGEVRNPLIVEDELWNKVMEKFNKFNSLSGTSNRQRTCSHGSARTVKDSHLGIKSHFDSFIYEDSSQVGPRPQTLGFSSQLRSG